MTTGIAATRAALSSLFASVEGMVSELTNFDNPTAPIDTAAIPGFFINGASTAKHEHTAAKEVTSTRTFFIIVIVAVIPENDPTGKEAAYALLQPFLEAVPLAFAAVNWMLEDDSGDYLHTVAGVTSLIDDVPEEIMREKKRFIAIPYRVSVTTNRSP